MIACIIYLLQTQKGFSCIFCFFSIYCYNKYTYCAGGTFSRCHTGVLFKIKKIVPPAFSYFLNPLPKRSSIRRPSSLLSLSYFYNTSRSRSPRRNNSYSLIQLFMADQPTFPYMFVTECDDDKSIFSIHGNPITAPSHLIIFSPSLY